MKSIGLVIFLAIVLIAAGCGNHKQPERDVSAGYAAETVDSVENSHQANTPAPEDEFLSTYVLSFENVRTGTLLPSIPYDQVGAILVEKEIHAHRMLIYTRPDNTELYYAGLQTDSDMYEIGAIGYPPAEGERFGIQEVSVLGRELVKVTGFCGANCPKTYYVELNQPALFLTVDAHAVETDLDNDGVNELIATHGTAAQTVVYQWQGEQVMFADFNVALQAEVVFYDRSQNLFQASTRNGNELYAFKWEEGRLVRAN
ncbi:hypothetical protein DUZ99_04825 [Xylanibacillus composti]|uniref:Uncharacterized protein n=1 Tax=Xylanibacillus composti TaxID=1572762 RepID=A0A8J4H5N8_9BACL|nr:hypothetical protein [Xylanibacillus composti]MDT9724313.1 hypothetical protein [Xylanibacillus composti]GIQ69309.1 hypothetical protein XYCOK13_21330 [Xylanibacillus composti]